MDTNKQSQRDQSWKLNDMNNKATDAEPVRKQNHVVKFLLIKVEPRERENFIFFLFYI